MAEGASGRTVLSWTPQRVEIQKGKRPIPPIKNYQLSITSQFLALSFPLPCMANSAHPIRPLPTILPLFHLYASNPAEQRNSNRILNLFCDACSDLNWA